MIWSIHDVDHLGAGDAGEKILAAAGEPDQLVRKDRVEENHAFGGGNGTVDPQGNRFGQKASAQLCHLASRQHPYRHQGVGIIPGVVQNGHVIGTGGQAEVPLQDIPAERGWVPNATRIVTRDPASRKTGSRRPSRRTMGAERVVSGTTSSTRSPGTTHSVARLW